MARYVVSDVGERLLGHLAQWHDQVTQMAPYFGGKYNLNKVEETLKIVQAGVLDAERRLLNMDQLGKEYGKRREDKGEAASAAHLVKVKEWVKRVKGILYRMEEFFEEVGIAERERDQQFLAGSCQYKLMIRPLFLMASDYNPCLRKMQKRFAQNFKALFWDLSETHNSMPEEAVVSGEDAHEDQLDQLMQPLMHCLAYSSLFPKAYEFKKTDLIHLWMAQGFLELPFNGNHQTPQEVGHQYFTEIIRDNPKAKENEKGEIISFVLPDDDHQMAVELGRGEYLFVDEDGDLINNTDNSIYHMSFIVGSSWEAPAWLLAAKHLRSLLLFPRDSGTSVTIQNLDLLLTSLTCLRALDLGRAELDNLPDSIGGLKHLRYLKLGGPLPSLPTSITRLQNLQTLDVQACPQLNFPNKFKNVMLVFNTEHHRFTVDESNSLDSLIGSAKAVGKFEIFFKTRRRRAVWEASRTDLKSKLIDDLVFEWSSSYQVLDAYNDNDEEESVLRRMKPPQSLNSLAVRFWKGTRFPSWEMSPYVNLPNLVSLEIEGCNRCTNFPSFSRLPSLTYLRLANLKALDYIEEIGAGGNTDIEAASAAYFRSLESLKLEDLPELKGWSTEIQQQVFPRLSHLLIHLCPRLMSMPQAPRLSSLSVEGINEKLLKKHIQPSRESPTSSSTHSPLPELRDLQIASVSELKSLSIYSDGSLSVKIKRCDELVNLRFPTSSDSDFGMLVEVYSCDRLRHISGALQDITKLKIWRCEKLELWDMMDDNYVGSDHMGRSISSSTSVGSPAWQGLTGLRSLTVGNITKLKSLPKSLACLTKLDQPVLFQLRTVRALPEWIGHLTGLRRLEIVDCTNMRTLPVSSLGELDSFTLRIERCQELIDYLLGGTSISLDGLEIHRCDRLKDKSDEELEVEASKVNDCLGLLLQEDKREGSSGSNSTSSGSVGSAAWQGLKTLRYLKLERISKMEYLPRGLASLTMLRRLNISHLRNLRELPEWIGHLSLLQHLIIVDCPNMRMLFGSVEGSVAACQGLTRLQSLKLEKISNLESLPRGLACLTALQGLIISQLTNLRELPEWIGHLSRLRRLDITECPKVTALPGSFHELNFLKQLSIRQCNPELQKRCQQTTGEYWSKIKHIREVNIE